MEETPLNYAKRILEKNNGYKGLARIWIVNMKRSSPIKSDIEFYTQAEKELDKL